MKNKKVAVVTGANRGLGLQVSKDLAAKHYHVIMVGRKLEALNQEVANINKTNQSAEAFCMDVTAKKDIQKLYEHIQTKFGGLDVLVNNAGVLLENFERNNPESMKAASALSVSDEIVLQTFTNNTIAPYNFIQKLAPLMKDRESANIVNVSSGMGQLSEMEGSYPGYRISKTALNAVTRIFSQELAPLNIKINSVCPGWVRTDMGGSAANRSVEEGASGIVWAATLGEDGLTGGSFRDGKKLDW